MLTLPHLKIFAVFSSFPLIIGDGTRNRETAVGIHHADAVDGAQFLKRIIHGEKISNRPGILLFTAPYKLCEGGCNGSANFGMVFPLFIGKKGAKAYKSMYHRDFKKIHSARPNAPFTKKTTRAPFTLCPTSECPTLPSTIETTTLVPSTVETTTLVPSTVETTTPVPSTVETTTPVPSTIEPTILVSCPPVDLTCPRHKSLISTTQLHGESTIYEGIAVHDKSHKRQHVSMDYSYANDLTK